MDDFLLILDQDAARAAACTQAVAYGTASNVVEGTDVAASEEWEAAKRGISVIAVVLKRRPWRCHMVWKYSRITYMKARPQ